LDISQKKALKAQAHHLKPVVLLGNKGLTPEVIAEINVALIAHELIKVKINGQEKEDRITMTQVLCQELSAETVQIIGNTSIIYRKNKEK
jgi:RNA-binding protein